MTEEEIKARLRRRDISSAIDRRIDAVTGNLERMDEETFFRYALIFQLGRIADIMENGVKVSGAVDTYEQNLGAG